MFSHVSLIWSARLDFSQLALNPRKDANSLTCRSLCLLRLVSHTSHCTLLSMSSSAEDDRRCSNPSPNLTFVGDTGLRLFSELPPVSVGHRLAEPEDEALSNGPAVAGTSISALGCSAGAGTGARGGGATEADEG